MKRKPAKQKKPRRWYLIFDCEGHYCGTVPLKRVAVETIGKMVSWSRFAPHKIVTVEEVLPKRKPCKK